MPVQTLLTGNRTCLIWCPSSSRTKSNCCSTTPRRKRGCPSICCPKFRPELKRTWCEGEGAAVGGYERRTGGCAVGWRAVGELLSYSYCALSLTCKCCTALAAVCCYNIYSAALLLFFSLFVSTYTHPSLPPFSSGLLLLLIHQLTGETLLYFLYAVREWFWCIEFKLSRKAIWRFLYNALGQRNEITRDGQQKKKRKNTHTRREREKERVGVMAIESDRQLTLSRSLFSIPYAQYTPIAIAIQLALFFFSPK